MKEIIQTYNRQQALDYAHKWANARNPKYTDFEKMGGDCTNFISQVIYAGSGVMNYKHTFGWYYINSNKRAPAWTGVDYFYNFITNNKGPGPFGRKVDISEIKLGDIVQLSFVGGNNFNHSLVVVSLGNPIRINNIKIATHTINRDYYPLSNYMYKDIRFIHIEGVRKLV